MGKIESLLEAAISHGTFPGCCFGYGGASQARGRLGRYTYCPESAEVGLDTLWDLASVSKVVGTTTAAMILYDRGLLKLEEPVARTMTAFSEAGKGHITVKNLLTHDSGLIAFRPYQSTCTNAEEVWASVCKEPLTYPTGTKMVYSDLNMIALQHLIEKLSGEPMPTFLKREVWEPLGMRDTQYNPGVGNPRCAPTDSVEPWRDNLRRLRGVRPPAAAAFPQFPDPDHWVQGEVHDPNAAVCGGVAGHAGLFSTVYDLERFAKFMLADGEELIKADTVRLFTRKQGDVSSRALGWDTKSPTGSSAGTKFGRRSFGHTGYTGTSLWIDPDARAFAILLTNRVHPTSENTKIIPFRAVFHDAVANELGL